MSPDDPPGIRTIVAPSQLEIPKIRGSRFWASVAPAVDIDAALACVERVRARWPDATHHCWAWRGAGRDAWRYADDGEPSGSAGKPILNAIDGRDLTRVVVVVTRYFGGTRLGVGGLVRAYGQCAAEALDAADIQWCPFTTTIEIGFDYDLSGAIRSVLNAHAVEPTATDYGATVQMRLVVIDGRVEGLLNDLRERTAGRAIVSPVAPLEGDR